MVDRIPSGTRDVLPDEMRELRAMTDRIRGVTVQGRADFLADGPERRALVERLLTKYHPRLEKLWGGRAMPPNRVMFKITPSRVHPWGLT